MNNDIVLVKTGGRELQGWKTVSIEKSIESLAGSFRLDLTNRWRDALGNMPIKIGSPVAIYIGSDLVVTGYVDTQSLSVDAESTSFSIEGRSKTGDLVDCSAMNKPGQWRKAKPITILKDLASPFGINVESDVDLGKSFDDFHIQPGETVYTAINRLCRLRNVLPTHKPNGDILITRAKTGHAATSIIEGENLLAGQMDQDAKDQVSTVTVKGQRAGSNTVKGKHITQAKAEKQNAAVLRYRPLLLRAEGQVDNAGCETRANAELVKRAAKSLKLTMTVQGWRQGNGQLWTPNTLVYCKSDSLLTDGTFLATKTTFSLDESGEKTEIELVNPAAYKAEHKAT